MDDRLLASVAAAVGTPVYVYDAAMIRERYATLTNALWRFPHRVHYAVKANSNLAVLAVVRAVGAGADIVSGGELHRALAAGFDPSGIAFSGVGKTDQELMLALRHGVGCINLESEGEADRLLSLAAGNDARARVGIRVNPDITAETHPYTQTGEKGMKFGVPVDRVIPLALRLVASGVVALVSIGVHIGSQIVDADPFREAAERLAGFVAALGAAGVPKLGSVSVGGGLGIAYMEGDRALDPDALARAIEPLHRATGLPIAVEPGRYLVGPAGVLLTRVLYRKLAGGRTIAVVDAGMNDLLRPSLYGATHPIRVVGPSASAPAEVMDVVGPLCESGDFLGHERRLGGARPGALLEVGGAGAYGFAMSSQYNSRPRAAEVLVDGARCGIVREREQVDDLMRGEHLEPQWMDTP